MVNISETSTHFSNIFVFFTTTDIYKEFFIYNTDLAQLEQLGLSQQPALGSCSLEVPPRRRSRLRGHGAGAREGEGEAAVRRHRGRGT